MNAGATLGMTRLYTVWVESSEYSADWVDSYYVVATSESAAKSLGEARLRSERPEADVTSVEAHEWRGGSKVLASYQPDEEQD